jgi:hypothetical protein
MATQNNIQKLKTLTEGKISILSSVNNKLISFKLPESSKLDSKTLNLIRSAIRISGNVKNEEAIALMASSLGLVEREINDNFVSYSKSRKSDISVIADIISLLNPKPKTKK